MALTYTDRLTGQQETWIDPMDYDAFDRAEQPLPERVFSNPAHTFEALTCPKCSRVVFATDEAWLKDENLEKCSNCGWCGPHAEFVKGEIND